MSAADQVRLSNFESIFSLDGKVAVVTGGSRGLGLHAASGLLQAGCSKVYITSRKAEACEEAVAALNALPNKRSWARAISVPADNSRISELDRLVAEVKKTTDHVDILFANAGATWGEKFDTHPEAMFSKVMDLNVKSVFYLIQKFTPLLSVQATRDDPSRVLITSSIAGVVLGTLGKNATFSYSASKAAAIHLAKNLAVELGPRHILTNAIAPGFYPSKMADALISLQGGIKVLEEKSPNKRVGRPEDIAGLVVFLSSRAASHLNGAVLITDGGAHLKGRLRVPLSLGLADLLDILRFRGRLLRPPAGFHWLRQAHRSAFASFYVMIVVMAALYITEYFPIYTLPDEFGPIMPVAIVSGVLTSVYAYGSACAAAKQYEQFGYVSGEVLFLVLAHYACAKGEQLTLTTWDIHQEKFRFMLIFWNMANVPMTYCHGAVFLASRHPATYAWDKTALALLYVA
ncbi:uncharacterized protein ATNIH1004_008034 [Aspergillus tanneri]|uniref:Uncharacterized protein n=3 Tax=Aspergillus tanneri TaxID=1220188 RepID=A0A5M9MHY8_9EURO|nr:uncharacterized protein ATNIH1004_008034 [Aspergillus tanneri]KAA8646601.1 hypothetical protein ATNIH1004_008034 [Aspergillus tanneri]